MSIKATVKPEEYLVIHPQRIIDSYDIIKRFLPYKRSDRTPFIYLNGIGTKDAYYLLPNGKKILCDRELALFIKIFNDHEWNKKNIIALDYNIEICSQWKDCGATIINGDWNDLNVIKNMREKMRILSSNDKTIKVSFFNTEGGWESVKRYDEWLNIQRPTLAFLLYSTRLAHTLKDVIKNIKLIKNYIPYNVGSFVNSQADGILGYKGLYMAIIKSYPNRNRKNKKEEK